MTDLASAANRTGVSADVAPAAAARYVEPFAAASGTFTAVRSGSILRELRGGSTIHVVGSGDKGGRVSKTVSAPAKNSSSEFAEKPEQLAERAFHLKAGAGVFTMHLPPAWRAGLFEAVDTILDEDNWELSDRLPDPSSFKTFLRTITFMKGLRRPGLGVTAAGNIVAQWLTPEARLSLECLPNDRVRWALSKGRGEDRRTVAGEDRARLLEEVLQPYGPGWWLEG